MSLRLAYLAGVVDSDGCIGIRMHKPSKSRKAVSYSVHIEIGQVEREAVALAKETFGGFVIKVPQKGKARPIFRWTAKSRVAVQALRHLRPYLRIKRLQAENAIRLGEYVTITHRKRFTSSVPGRVSPRSRTIDEITVMHSMYLEQKRLNSGHKS